MFEDDYIMRIIHEMVRAILKLVCNADIESPLEELVEDTETKNALIKLQEMVDRGDINEAENKLYDLLERKKDQGMEAAILFYEHINKKDNSFLEAHNYSRDEVKSGIKDTMSRFGLGNVVDTLLQEEEE